METKFYSVYFGEELEGVIELTDGHTSERIEIPDWLEKFAESYIVWRYMVLAYLQHIEQVFGEEYFEVARKRLMPGYEYIPVEMVREYDGMKDVEYHRFYTPMEERKGRSWIHLVLLCEEVSPQEIRELPSTFTIPRYAYLNEMFHSVMHNRRLSAIKLYRTLDPNIGLEEAKEVAERLEDRSYEVEQDPTYLRTLTI